MSYRKHFKTSGLNKMPRLIGMVGEIVLPDSEPIASGAVSEWEYLWGEVVLAHLLSAQLVQIPLAHRVVEAARPQLRPVRRNVDARGPVRVTLESSEKILNFIWYILYLKIKTASSNT